MITDPDICQRRGCRHDADSHLNGTGACGWCPCAEMIAPEPAEPAEPDPAAAALGQLGALWSPDFAAYASGELDVSQVRCVLCLQRPCACPPFGSPEYFALIDQRHGRGTR